MHCQHSTTVATLLALAPVIIVAQNTTTPLNIPLNFNCSTFSAPGGGQEIANYTAPYNQTLRVSKAAICPNDNFNKESCQLRADGALNVTATTNATDISDARLLHAMLKQGLQLEGASNSYLNDYFTTSMWKHAFNNTGMNFNATPGTSAYVGFTPTMTCYDGVVSTNSSCSTSDEGIRNVKDKFENRALQICIPTKKITRSGSGKRRRTRTRIAGTLELVTISEDEAEKEEMKTNPADPPRSTPTPDPNWRPSSGGLGGSGSVEMHWTSLGIGLLVAVWMVGVM